MKRTLMSSLDDWKASDSRKPLLLSGARQVGKTYLVREFAKTHYSNLVELNFNTTESLKTIFDKDISPSYIINQLEIRYNTKIHPENTLIFFDEIQESQRAMDSLKSFSDIAPEYHIIAAGSFLGVMIGRQPVGQTNHLTLYPMTFCEYLDAVGLTSLANAIAEKDFETLAGLTDILEKHLLTYYFVGGMPAAVKEYINSHDLAKVREIQYEILSQYKSDFSKHIPELHTATKIRMLWDAIPAHLFKENKKFVYKNIKVGGRAAEFENAMQWLTDTGLIYKINKVETPKIPLSMHYKEHFFKLYMLDVGLFCAKAEIDQQDIFTPNLCLVDEMNGAIAEQFVLQEMKASGIRPIFYWGRDKGVAEIDFLTQINGQIIPIEVKSAKRTKSQSLKVYIQEYKPTTAIRTSLKNYGVENRIISIPLYAMASLKELIFK